MKPNEYAIGTPVEFTAQRIIKGNPVRGIITACDEEWMEVKLLKMIEGKVNVWEAGERKSFRISLIVGGLKPI